MVCAPGMPDELLDEELEELEEELELLEDEDEQLPPTTPPPPLWLLQVLAPIQLALFSHPQPVV